MLVLDTSGLLAALDGTQRFHAAAREALSDLGVGLADASNVVLANRHGTSNILALDERHFRVLRRPRDRPFRLLPADAE